MLELKLLLPTGYHTVLHAPDFVSRYIKKKSSKVAMPGMNLSAVKILDRPHV